MCGRYNLEDNDDTQALMDDLGVSFGRANIPSFFNLAPTEQIPVVSEEEGIRALRPMRWWLTPVWAKEITTQYSMFNARAETLDKSKAFQGSFRHHRIIIPMTSFIEWRKEGALRQPYLVRYEQGCMAAAGVWSQWTDGEIVLDTCAMVTTNACKDFKAFHSRQPLFLDSKQANTWLEERADLKDLRELLKAPLPQSMLVRAIDPSINNSRLKDAPRYLNDSQEIIVSS
ncbi:SOS response-associated peptidase [Marinobacterium sp. xm-d-530]|jgi:putative SOS response-associated peptidase YedK|uniref:SOS response-associated peptidase n=1 Tax=Marinobacterium sp. xm-d-530 TaxID=2497747 RepID=UPI001568689E|nr:SOS response-associated peptidase [Marinobacterium sp. xm-d-530]NRQ01318.1 putative SOS response-associated peptidase YedK [Marinobacterium sp. xm-d-530]